MKAEPQIRSDAFQVRHSADEKAQQEAIAIGRSKDWPIVCSKHWMTWRAGDQATG